jgi:hypothetical protein
MYGGGFDAEVSYMNGNRVTYGTSGSVRADAIYGYHAAPDFAVELKTGRFQWIDNEQINNYMDHLPSGTKLYSIWVR